jgi:uncharacterized protein
MNEKTLIDFLALQNKWWFNPSDFPSNRVHSIKRSDFYHLYKNKLEEEKALVIVGPRGVGKSTVMFEMMKKLIEEEKIDPKRIFYCTFEQPSLQKSSLLDIARIYAKAVLKEDIGQMKEKTYLFMDEIQNIEDWGDQIKVLQDLGLPLKFILSGSSSVAMINESSKAARRIELYSMYPLKFYDFLRFKIQDKKLEEIIKERKKLGDLFIDLFVKKDAQKIYELFLQFYQDLKPWQTKIELAFQEYLKKGGYPQFVNEEDYFKCSSELSQTFWLGFHKDLVHGKGIGDPRGLEDLAKYIASISSSSTHLSSLMRESNSATNTEILKKYLYHLEKSHLVSESQITSNGIAKRGSSFKIYLVDIAIRNMLQGLMNDLLLEDQTQTGFAIETLVYDHCARFWFKMRPNLPVQYWTDKKGEIDLILKLNGEKIPIEVKKADFPSSSDLVFLRNFCKKNNCPGINLCGQKLAIEENLIFIPYWLFILIC